MFVLFGAPQNVEHKLTSLFHAHTCPPSIRRRMSAEQLEKMQQEQYALEQEVMELEKAEPTRSVRITRLTDMTWQQSS